MTNVGNVHNSFYIVTEITQVLLKNILHDVGTEVADVSKVVNSRAAGVHFYLAFFKRDKLLFLLTESVIKYHFSNSFNLHFNTAISCSNLQSCCETGSEI